MDANEQTVVGKVSVSKLSSYWRWFLVTSFLGLVVTSCIPIRLALSDAQIDQLQREGMKGVDAPVEIPGFSEQEKRRRAIEGMHGRSDNPWEVGRRAVDAERERLIGVWESLEIKAGEMRLKNGRGLKLRLWAIWGFFFASSTCVSWLRGKKTVT